MDIWHRIGRIVRLSNLGTLIFFLLNMGLICLIIAPYGMTPEIAVGVLIVYTVSVLIGLSPVGEWVLGLFAGAKEIKRRDVKIRLIPLLEIVFGQAKQRTPNLVDSICLKIVRDPNPNAFAIGRRTICVTEGLLQLSDAQIMAVFAHELGHIAYKHTTLQLLIGGGNFLISGFLLLIKLISWMITALFALFAIGSRRLGRGIFITLIGSISTISIWLWTKFCMLFLTWSMRQNEYAADEYAFRLGYGKMLESLLSTGTTATPTNGFLKALFATHPDNDNRIARLQDLAADFS